QLEVQAAQRPPTRAGVIVLNERAVDAVFAVLRGVVGLEEEAAAIGVHVGFDHHDARKFGLHHPHGHASCSSIRRRYWPYALDPIARASRARSAAVMYPMR